MKKITAALTAISGLGSALPVLAVNLKDQVDTGLNYGTFSGLGTRDVREVIFLVINIILGFLSIIAILGVLYGGFQMMTAGGNEDKTASGKTAIVAGVVGLAVIFTAWAITAFVVRSLVNVTG